MSVAVGPHPRLLRGAIERRLFVDAPPDVVWAALHDPSCPTWRDVRLHLDPAGPDWPAAGARRHARFRVGPVVVGVTLESLEAHTRVGRVLLRLDRAGIGPRLEAELAALKQRAEAAAARST